MLRFLSVLVLCAFVNACSNSNSNNTQTPDTTLDPLGSSELSPTTMTLDSPPTNGKLPAELLPPA